MLFVTDERRQESRSRAKYAEVERHSCTNRRRRVDAWRAVIDWSEQQVWDALRRWRIRPHPAYWLGWGRVSVGGELNTRNGGDALEIGTRVRGTVNQREAIRYSSLSSLL